VALYSIKWPTFDFLLSPEEILEGVEKEDWIATSCLNCPTRCAIKVRVVNDERAVRIIGNSNSAYSDGKTCPRSHVGLQVLYNPGRITKPLRRKQGISKGKNEDLSWAEQWDEITWEDAWSDIQNRFNGINADKLLIIQGLNTTSDEDLINHLAKSCGTTNLLREDTLEIEANKEGKRLANISQNSGYDLENTNYVLSFGADLLESEYPLSRNLRLWGKIRRERPNKARVVVIDSRYSVTASRADEWIPINPGTEGALAMSLAHVIISEELHNTEFITDYTSNFNEYKTQVLKDEFSPDNIAEKTGISANEIRRIAREFVRCTPAIAWSGAGATSWPHGTNTSHAILCLNALVGSIDSSGGIIFQNMPDYKAVPDISSDPGISLRDAKEKLSNITKIIGFNNNLIMSVPDTKIWDEALASDDLYYVHVAPSQTEMAQYADIILPSCTYLEEWAYESAPPGSGYAEAKIKQPVVEPPENVKSTAGIIFNLVEQLGGFVASNFDKDSIGSNPEGFVRYRTKDLIFWDTFKQKGVWKGEDYQYGRYEDIFVATPHKFTFNKNILSADKLINVDFKGSSSDKALVLTTYHPVLDIRNGNQNYPWAQEIFLVMHGYGWSNFIEMNSLDADEIGVGDGDMVWVKSEYGEVKIRARVFEGIVRGVVAIATGQGHYSCGKWADGIGVNPNDIIALDYDEESGQASFRNTKVLIEKV